jgi:hypothetical protein
MLCLDPVNAVWSTQRLPAALPAGQLHSFAAAKLSSSLLPALSGTAAVQEGDTGGCTGLNLAWYLQYLEPKVVKKPLLVVQRLGVRYRACTAG